MNPTMLDSTQKYWCGSWECGSVVQVLASMWETLSLILGIKKKKRHKKKRKYCVGYTWILVTTNI
jgi:hypothetical protein